MIGRETVPNDSQSQSHDKFVVCFHCVVSLYYDNSLDCLALETRGQRLSQLICLFGVGDNQGVQKTGASDLEFCLTFTLADLDKLGVRSAGLLEEITDIGNLLRHDVDNEDDD